MKKLFKNEIISYIREPFALFFTIILPIGLTFLYGQAFGKYDYNEKFTGYDVGMIFNVVFLASNLGLMGLVMTIFEKKATFTYKRYLLLPLEKIQHFALNIFSTALISILISSVVILLNYILYEPLFKINIFFIVVYTLVNYFFFSIGYFISTIKVSPKTGQAIGIFTFFVFLFLSGLIIPLDELSSPFLKEIALYSPMQISLNMFLLTNDLKNIADYLNYILVFCLYLVVVTIVITRRKLEC